MNTAFFATPEGMATAGALVLIAIFLLKSLFRSDGGGITGMLIVFGIIIGAAILFIMSLDPIESPGMSVSAPQIRLPSW